MKYQSIKLLTMLLVSSCFILDANAEPKGFKNGKMITEYGQFASVDADLKIPKGSRFKILFDTAKNAEAGSVNNTLNTAARFLNMHSDAGLSEEEMELAIVFHGKGSFDVANNKSYGKKYDGAVNVSIDLIQALTDKGVRIILCGQSAAYHGIAKEDLAPGVEMAL